MPLTPEQEYYARVCERDDAWERFCKYLTHTTWERYDEAEKAAEDAYAHWKGSMNGTEEITSGA